MRTMFKVLLVLVVATAMLSELTDHDDKAASAWACAAFIVACDISLRLKR